MFNLQMQTLVYLVLWKRERERDGMAGLIIKKRPDYDNVASFLE